MRFGRLQPSNAGYYNQEVSLTELLNRYHSAVATLSNVSDTNASTTLLASNLDRKGFSIYNDSTAILYVAMDGSTASLTNFSFEIKPEGFYETWGGYTGLITGIWASDASGAGRITEYS